MIATYAQLQVDSAAAWRAWLQEHHADVAGVWLVTWKKGHGPFISYNELVDEAIAFGWVDSLPRTVDEHRSQRLMTPRKPGSNWSRVNKGRVARLTAGGLMHPSGLSAVQAAQRDGSWTALDAVEELQEPAELRTALDAEPAARGHWDAFPRSTRRAILEWIGTAKTEPTRARRITETVSQAATGRRANQWRQPTR